MRSTTTRLAGIGLGAVLLLLAAFAVGATLVTNRAVGRATKATALSAAYERARFGVGRGRVARAEIPARARSRDPGQVPARRRRGARRNATDRPDRRRERHGGRALRAGRASSVPRGHPANVRRRRPERHDHGSAHRQRRGRPDLRSDRGNSAGRRHRTQAELCRRATPIEVAHRSDRLVGAARVCDRAPAAGLPLAVAAPGAAGGDRRDRAAQRTAPRAGRRAAPDARRARARGEQPGRDGGAAPQRPAARVGRPARRRCRARLQQPAPGHPRLLQPARAKRARGQPAKGHGNRHRRGAWGRADASAARVRTPPDAEPRGLGRERDRRERRVDAGARASERDRLQGAAVGCGAARTRRPRPARAGARQPRAERRDAMPTAARSPSSPSRSSSSMHSPSRTPSCRRARMSASPFATPASV